jgi:hypothetical protein
MFLGTVRYDSDFKITAPYCAAPKDDSGVSAAELVYGCRLVLPGQMLPLLEPIRQSKVQPLYLCSNQTQGSLGEMSAHKKTMQHFDVHGTYIQHDVCCDLLLLWCFDPVTFYYVLQHFVSVMFYYSDILSLIHFATVTFCLCNILLLWHFDPVTFYYCNILTPIQSWAKLQL